MTIVCLLFSKAVICGLLLSKKEVGSQCLRTVKMKARFKEHSVLVRQISGGFRFRFLSVGTLVYGFHCR